MLEATALTNIWMAPKEAFAVNSVAKAVLSHFWVCCYKIRCPRVSSSGKQETCHFLKGDGRLNRKKVTEQLPLTSPDKMLRDPRKDLQPYYAKTSCTPKRWRSSAVVCRPSASHHKWHVGPTPSYKQLCPGTQFNSDHFLSLGSKKLFQAEASVSREGHSTSVGH